MHERKEIGRRTRQALAIAKSRGVKLGTAGARNIKKANDAKKRSADAFATQIKPLVQPLREAGEDLSTNRRHLEPHGNDNTTGNHSIRHQSIDIPCALVKGKSTSKSFQSTLQCHRD